jgi:PIN domain nuclease of toxin-antitoxin system
VRLLLDTHAFLWFITDDPKLSVTAQALITDPDNEILVSGDQQIEADLDAGRLNAVLAEVDRECEAGPARPL